MDLLCDLDVDGFLCDLDVDGCIFFVTLMLTDVSSL